LYICQCVSVWLTKHKIFIFPAKTYSYNVNGVYFIQDFIRQTISLKKWSHLHDIICGLDSWGLSEDLLDSRQGLYKLTITGGAARLQADAQVHKPTRVIHPCTDPSPPGDKCEVRSQDKVGRAVTWHRLVVE